jgi:hypothetical protein
MSIAQKTLPTPMIPPTTQLTFHIQIQIQTTNWYSLNMVLHSLLPIRLTGLSLSVSW